MWVEFNLWHLVWFVILGGFVGWLAGLAFRGRGFGCLGNVAVGVVGAVVGGLFFRLIGWVFGGLLGSLFPAFVGAVLFLAVINLFKRR
ncbi:MAG: GlsB/YeaQ/YmgE family stress response membrane protein [candidate division Zixibacteria bacterium]|nr:GlsB/YeaQ/YmgE family stress response membrane protein [candidate division Zixibacteria bacterium]